MNWKQFLKPDWRKIVVFAIIFVLFFIFAGRDFGIIGTIFLLFSYFPNIILMENLSSYLSWLEISLLSFIFAMIYWYLISCLIVWIYDKSRKRK